MSRDKDQGQEPKSVSLGEAGQLGGREFSTTQFLKLFLRGSDRSYPGSKDLKPCIIFMKEKEHSCLQKSKNSPTEKKSQTKFSESIRTLML